MATDIIDKNLVLISAPIVFRKEKGIEGKWLIVKLNEDDGWEFPKVVVRKGESSVRAAIRVMGEKANLDGRVIEEAGRVGGATTINGKTSPKRTLYYVMLEKSSGEIIGFSEYEWLTYASAVRKLSSKTERKMLKVAREEMEKFLKERKRRKEQEEE